jgi:cell division protein FtsL
MATRLAPARPDRALRPDTAPAPSPAPDGSRHLRVVPRGYVTTRARRRRARRLVVLAGAAIAAALFGVVAFHVVLTQNQLDIQHLQSEADAASVKQQQLRLQAAELESPERVVDAAQKLGMVPPATVHYLSPNGEAPPVKATPTTVPARASALQTSTAKPATAKTPATTTPAAKTAAPKKAAATSPSPSTTAPSRLTR